MPHRHLADLRAKLDALLRQAQDLDTEIKRVLNEQKIPRAARATRKVSTRKKRTAVP